MNELNICKKHYIYFDQNRGICIGCEYEKALEQKRLYDFMLWFSKLEKWIESKLNADRK